MNCEPFHPPRECPSSLPTFLGFDAFCTIPPGAHRTVDTGHGPLELHESADFSWTAADERARVKRHVDIRP